MNTQLILELLYLDLAECTWCQGTEAAFDAAAADPRVRAALEASGTKLAIFKIHVDSAARALELGFLTSPTIRVNGRDLQPELQEKPCESCGAICGDSTDCRVWLYQGKETTSPPPELIIEALLEAIAHPAEYAPPMPLKELPENLARFFTGKTKQAANDCCCGPDSGGCCG